MSEFQVDIELLLSRVLAWVAERSEAQVTCQLDLLEAGVLDSMGFIDLIAFIEEAAGRQLDLLDIEPEEFATIEGLCRFALLKSSPQ